MPLEAGRQLGPYEIVSAIGAGGMGEVYKARDTRLDRTVAIKVLPEHVASDPDLKQRFEREAKTISSLNHPHICTLYDIGCQDGIDFLVMEYLEGETLAQRLQKGALPLDQALKIAIEIADALDKAHRQGITHRDLKPGNIMLTTAGAKLLDFGLAKLRPQTMLDASAEDTLIEPSSSGRLVLGTLGYMAPEQLESQAVDARADLFAFGAMLYLAITGRSPFEAESQAGLVAAVLHGDPAALEPLPAPCPAALDRLVRRCLARDPDHRWQTARDLQAELEWIREARTAPTEAQQGAQAPVWNRVGVFGVIAATAFIAGGVTMWSIRQAPTPSTPVTRFSVTLPSLEELYNGEGGGLALSTDGRELVYVGRRDDGLVELYRRSMDEVGATAIRGTEGARSPFFSPDGRWVAFGAANTLKKVSLDGGPPLTLAPAPGFHGGSWGPDDTIIFSTSAGLSRVSESGGPPESLTKIDAERGEVVHGRPALVPGGRAMVFAVWSTAFADTAQIALQSLEDGTRLMLGNGNSPQVTSTGHLVFARADSLWAVPFDVDRLEMAGTPVPVEGGIQVHSLGLGMFTVADEGTLAYVPGGLTRIPDALVWVDRTGATTDVPIPREERFFWFPRFSPDGRRVAVHVGDDGSRDVWMYDVNPGTLGRLTSNTSFDGWPIWTPDGDRLTFSATDSRDLHWQSSDGSGQPSCC